MRTPKIANKKTSKLGRKIDYKKIARAYGILRNKSLKPLKVQRSLRDQWQ
jgi:hypothetical protein